MEFSFRRVVGYDGPVFSYHPCPIYCVPYWLKDSSFMNTERLNHPWETGWALLTHVVFVTCKNFSSLPNLKNSPTVCVFYYLTQAVISIYIILLFLSPKAITFQIIYFASLDLETDDYNHDSKPIFCCPALSWVIGYKCLFPLYALPFC